MHVQTWAFLATPNRFDFNSWVFFQDKNLRVLNLQLAHDECKFWLTTLEVADVEIYGRPLNEIALLAPANMEVKKLIVVISFRDLLSWYQKQKDIIKIFCNK